jgi:hypothetical protein
MFFATTSVAVTLVIMGTGTSYFVLKKYSGLAWTEFVWRKIKTTGELL